MKRMLFGILWFVVIFVVLYLLFSIAEGFLAVHSAGAGVAANYHEGLQAGIEFAKAHAAALAIWRLVILLASIVLAVVGAVTGKLPGTRKPPPAK